MTNKEYTYILRIINQETGLLMTKYPNDVKLLDRLHSDMQMDVGDDSVKAFVNYLTKLIRFCEYKEDYEKCGKLLRIKNTIKEYTNE